MLLFSKDQEIPTASITNIEEETSLPNEAEALQDEPEEIEFQNPDVEDMDDTETQPHNQVSLFMTSFILVLHSSKKILCDWNHGRVSIL